MTDIFSTDMNNSEITLNQSCLQSYLTNRNKEFTTNITVLYPKYT